MTEPESKREKMDFLYKYWQKNHCSEAASQQLCPRPTIQCKKSAVASFKPTNSLPKGKVGKLENGIRLKEVSNQKSGHATSLAPFIIIKRSQIEGHHLLSNIFPGTKFTCKEKTDNRLSFLHVNIRRLDNRALETCVYCKPIHMDYILPTTPSHTKETVQTLFRRARTHCSTSILKSRSETADRCLSKKLHIPAHSSHTT